MGGGSSKPDIWHDYDAANAAAPAGRLKRSLSSLRMNSPHRGSSLRSVRFSDSQSPEDPSQGKGDKSQKPGRVSTQDVEREVAGFMKKNAMADDKNFRVYMASTICIADRTRRSADLDHLLEDLVRQSVDRQATVDFLRDIVLRRHYYANKKEESKQDGEIEARSDQLSLNPCSICTPKENSFCAENSVSSSFGVNSEFLRHFRDQHLNSAEAKSVESSMLKQSLVQYWTGKRNCTLVDALPQEYVGAATVFVSNAYSSSVIFSLDVMLKYSEAHPEAFFWVDLFSFNHCKRIDRETLKETLNKHLKAISKTLVITSPLYTHVVSQLASSLSQKGDFADAVRLQKILMEGQEATVGPMDQETLKTASSLALLFRKLGQLEDAELLVRRVIKGCEADFGTEHPHTVNCLSNLAGLLQSQGKLSDAGALLQRTLATREKQLGRENPKTVKNLLSLASVKHQMNALQEALELYQQATRTIEAVFGAKHEMCLYSSAQVARVLGDQGRHAEAEVLLRKNLAVAGQAYGEGHAETVTLLGHLGMNLQAQQQWEEAANLFQSALQGTTKLRGESHKTTLNAAGNYIGLLVLQGKAGDAKVTKACTSLGQIVDLLLTKHSLKKNHAWISKFSAILKHGGAETRHLEEELQTEGEEKEEEDDEELLPPSPEILAKEGKKIQEKKPQKKSERRQRKEEEDRLAKEREERQKKEEEDRLAKEREERTINDDQEAAGKAEEEQDDYW